MAVLMQAKDFVTGAETCFNAGASASCALRCYAAAIVGATIVLEWLWIRQPKWSHEGNRFSLEAIKRRQLSAPEVVEHIRRAHYLHRDALYSTKDRLTRKNPLS